MFGRNGKTQNSNVDISSYQPFNGAAGIINTYNNKKFVHTRRRHFNRHASKKGNGLAAYTRPLAKAGRDASYEDYIKFCNQATKANKQFKGSCANAGGSLGGFGSMLSSVAAGFANFAANAIPYIPLRLYSVSVCAAARRKMMILLEC